MSNILTATIAAFVTFPVFVYLIAFMIGRRLTKNDRRSVHIALDITTFFLIVSVHSLCLVIWERSFLWMILSVIILVSIGFVLSYWKVRHEIIFGKVFKGIWRMLFLLFSLAYILLIAMGLFKRIMDYVS